MAEKVRRTPFVPSYRDPVLSSTLVLHNLLISECKYSPSSQDYMCQVQEHLAPHHRKIVTDWMLEVCKEQKCSPQVFLSSVQYLDRVLSQLPIKTGQLQLLASACLLLSSKLHDPHPLSLYNLVVYTDCSISMPELQSMEMLVLEKLRWELASPNPGQFLEIIVANMDNILSNQVLSLVQKHAGTFLDLAATEYRFYNVKPSILACSSILLAIQSLSPPISSQHEIPNLLISLTQTPQAHLSMITSYLQQSVSMMMADTCNTKDKSDTATYILDNTSDTATDILDNTSDTNCNNNNIKCGVSGEVVTMDIT